MVAMPFDRCDMMPSSLVYFRNSFSSRISCSGTGCRRTWGDMRAQSATSINNERPSSVSSCVSPRILTSCRAPSIWFVQLEGDLVSSKVRASNRPRRIIDPRVPSWIASFGADKARFVASRAVEYWAMANRSRAGWLSSCAKIASAGAKMAARGGLDVAKLELR